MRVARSPEGISVVGRRLRRYWDAGTLFDDGIPRVWFEAEKKFLRELGLEDVLFEDDEEAPLTLDGKPVRKACDEPEVS